ncbi:FAD-dependent oxidoreductase [Sphingobium sp. HBC34]|uniref:FAD-dependent oxidoreductase n=1 Tax=Sphingobium cyanobacteriorum TaxID=3063954 RepID=A0ABT8ZS09_9SPHN|nr:FAD-dependent oxidoreductase [Sphingobium sp. HBC34]MDO7837320.1 FAD-dependent oxidoreductase [Sphingobium sp. HBC34]
MKRLETLVVGAGIGGLSAAIALRRGGHHVTVIERDPQWSVYGVGIIQQANVVRAMDQLGVLDAFLDAACGFDAVEIYIPSGDRVARVPAPSLVPGKPANVGIGRRALQKVLGDSAKALGADIRLGVTVDRLVDDGAAVDVGFSDGGAGRYDVVVGADGVYSQTRATILPDAEKPEFTGQGVWRYNFPRPADLDALHVYNGPIGVGLVPMSAEQMYLFATSAEPGNPHYPKDKLAATMRMKLANTAPQIQVLASQIVDDEDVVYRPLEAMMVHGPWSKGRVVLLGDAVHATTPHLGQGAGMAIEDAIVLADELGKADSPQAAFAAYRDRRYARCRYIVEQSLAICHGQIGKGPPVDNHKATADMFAVVSQPI